MLAGRREERRVIDSLVAGARLGESGVLVLRGEPGIGKTTLLRHARERATGFRVLAASGTENERDLPFAGLSQLLIPLHDLSALPEPQAQALGSALALRPGGRPDRFAVGAGLLTLLVRSSESAPTLVLVDDAHWLDRSSTDALVFTSRRLLADPVLVLVVVRETEPSAWDASGLPTMLVERLDDAACGQLVDDVTEGRLSPAQRARVAHLSRGNPLAVRELARAPELLEASLPGVPPTVPALLTATFGRRAGELGDPERTALAVTALADGQLRTVVPVLDRLGLSVELLAAAERAALLELGPQEVRFTHPLVRSAAVAGVAPEERRRLHALVADALPAEAADLRALHRSASLVAPDDRVAAALEEVGERATSRAAFAEAAGAHERAARLSTRTADRARRLLLAGEASFRSGEHPRAVRLLGEAATERPPPDLLARIDALDGMVAAKSGSLTRARDRLFRAAAQASEQAPEQALILYADLVDVCLYLLDTAAAERAAEFAAPLVDRVGGYAAAVGEIAIGMAAVFAGEPAAERLRSGVARLSASPPPVGDVHAAWDLLGPLFLRESDTGHSLVRQAEDRVRDNADLGSLPHLLFHLARYDATGERWQVAASRYGEAIEIARETDQSTELAMSLAGLAWLSGRQGRESECRLAAAEALELALLHEVRMARVWSMLALAEVDLAAGAAEAAVEQLLRVDAWLEDLGVRDPDISPVPELAEGLARAGRGAESARRVAAFVASAEHKGQPWALARARRSQALLAGDEDARGLFTEALELHAASPDRFEEARTRLVYGERLRRARHRVEARTQLRGALEVFDHLGATPWSDRAVAELAATGERVHRRAEGPVTALTQRELQIALLLADGMTTRQAAAALFLSPKTVEYHLRHVYTKLGIGSRAELAGALLSRGG